MGSSPKDQSTETTSQNCINDDVAFLEARMDQLNNQELKQCIKILSLALAEHKTRLNNPPDLSNINYFRQWLNQLQNPDSNESFDKVSRISQAEINTVLSVIISPQDDEDMLGRMNDILSQS